MSFKTKIVLLCFVAFSPFVNGVEEDDIKCLKSIKQSLEDPMGRLSSWDFTNTKVGVLCNKFVGISCWNDRENRILSVELRDMGLRGSFPQGIEYCGSLTSLDLSGNQLSGSIPSDLCERVKYLTHLDLSNNVFSGEIPATIVDCAYLNRLALNNNKLSGAIPEGIGRMGRLSALDLSDNELVGSVPVGFGARSFANNTGLCGEPLKPCKQEEEKDNFSSIFMVGFAIGWVVFAVLYISAGLVIIRSRQCQRREIIR